MFESGKLLVRKQLNKYWGNPDSDNRNISKTLSQIVPTEIPR